MKFIIQEINRIWEDRESIGHKLPSRANLFSETNTLKEVWDWIVSDGTGCRGDIEIIKEEE